mgnify:FL=1
MLVKPNPFKYGSVVSGDYFTDRREETAEITSFINSPNHLILISPRRFGKTSLIRKVLSQTDRHSLYVNVQNAGGPTDLALLLLKAAYKLNRWEQFKTALTHFRFMPTISVNPITGGVDISFSGAATSDTLLEDAFTLLEKLGTETNRLIVVLDEFQDVLRLEPHIDRRLRAIIQEQRNINYIFLGSQESLMTEIFEKVQSPFFHFGRLMHLSKLPHDEFLDYLFHGFQTLISDSAMNRSIAESVLKETRCHPYYTQQLASEVWNLIPRNTPLSITIVNRAIENLVNSHDLDFDRLWDTLPQSQRKVLLLIAQEHPFANVPDFPATTLYSAAQKLQKAGLLIKTPAFEVEDPFFRHWIKSRQLA